MITGSGMPVNLHEGVYRAYRIVRRSSVLRTTLDSNTHGDGDFVQSTEGTPPELLQLSNPDGWFAHKREVINQKLRQQGQPAFLYRPVVLSGGRHFSLFVRIEAQSEILENSQRTSFVHLAMLAFEDKWEPALIPYAARRLFSSQDGSCLGNPIHMTATEHIMPHAAVIVARSDLPSLGREIPGAPRWAGERLLHAYNTMPHGLRYEDLGVSIAQMLTELRLEFQGRWLPFALGKARRLRSAGPEYFLVLDDRREEEVEGYEYIDDSEDGSALSDRRGLPWDDLDPPLVLGKQNNSVDGVTEIDWLTLRPHYECQPFERSEHLLNDRTIWPDQRKISGIDDIDNITPELSPVLDASSVDIRRTAIGSALKPAILSDEWGHARQPPIAARTERAVGTDIQRAENDLPVTEPWDYAGASTMPPHEHSHSEAALENNSDVAPEQRTPHWETVEEYHSRDPAAPSVFDDKADREKSYHAYRVVYSKLIQGRSHTGPIRQGTEARIVGKTADTPSELLELCHPECFFANKPEITNIDPGRLKGGAFVYRPVVLSGRRHFSIFIRMEARSEQGENKPGRKFVHCAMLAFEDHWEPRLIPYAARRLFSSSEGAPCLGNPIYSALENRLDLEKLEVKRTALPHPDDGPDPVSWDGGDRLLAHRRAPEGRSQEELGLSLARLLEQQDLGFHGRWLSFAMGISTRVRATGPGFFMMLDNRDEGENTGHRYVESDAQHGPRKFLSWSDARPPLVLGTHFDTVADAMQIDWQALRQIGTHGQSDLSRSLVGEDAVWADQRTASGTDQIGPLNTKVPETTGLDRPGVSGLAGTATGFEPVMPSDFSEFERQVFEHIRNTEAGGKATQAIGDVSRDSRQGGFAVPIFQAATRFREDWTDSIEVNWNISGMGETPPSMPDLEGFDYWQHFGIDIKALQISVAEVEEVFQTQGMIWVRPALRQIAKRVDLLDHAYPDRNGAGLSLELHMYPLGRLLRVIMAYVMFHKPEDLKAPAELMKMLGMVLSHERIEILDVDACPPEQVEGGLLAGLLVRLARKFVGREQIRKWFVRVSQAERNQRGIRERNGERFSSERAKENSKALEDLLDRLNCRNDGGRAFDPDAALDGIQAQMCEELFDPLLAEVGEKVLEAMAPDPATSQTLR